MASRRITRTKSFSSYLSSINDEVSVLKSRDDTTGLGLANGSVSANSLADELSLASNGIHSSNYIPNYAGWRISGSGVAEFSDVFVRGDINAYSGTIGYWNISSPSVSRTFGDITLYGTFLESAAIGDSDVNKTSGTYVALFKSYELQPNFIVSKYRRDNIATITTPGHAFLLGDKVYVSIDGDVDGFNALASPVSIIQATGDTISYINDGVDFTNLNSSGDAVTNNSIGTVTLYNPDVAGLYLKDYSKREFDYGYFSNTGVSYTSAEDINVIENPSFEYNSAYSDTSWAAGAGLTLTSSGVSLSSSSVYRGGSAFGLGLNWTTAVSTYLTGNIDYTAGKSYNVFGLGRNLYFGISIFPKYTPAESTISSIQTFNLTGNFTSATATATTITYTGSGLNFSAGQYITVPQPGTVGFTTNASRFNITNQKIKTANSTTVTVELAGAAVSETAAVTASTGLLRVIIPATSPFTSGDTAFLDADAGVYNATYGEITNYYSPHTIADGTQGYTYTVAPFPVPTTTTFYLQTEYGFTETTATNLTLESHYNTGGVVSRTQKIFKPYELALDLSAIAFTYSTGSVSTSISNVLSSGTTALWSSSSRNKYLISTANDYMLGYLDSTVKIPAMKKSISTILDGASINAAYLAADATGYNLSSDIKINIPGWLVLHDGNGIVPPSPTKLETIGYIADSVYLSTASNFFYGNELTNYRWYTATTDAVVSGPSQASIEGTKSWIDVNLVSQSAHLDYFDYVGFRNNTFDYTMTARPGITILDTTATIAKFPDSVYETTTVTGGKYQYSTSSTTYRNISPSLKLLTGERSSAFELSTLSKTVNSSGTEDFSKGAVVYGVYNQNDSGSTTIYTGSDKFVWTSYTSLLDNENLAQVIFEPDLATFKQKVLGLSGFTGSTLRLTTSSALSLISSSHALQLGATESANLRADSNEIQAVTASVASTMFLNRSGGNVNIGNAASTITVIGDLKVNGAAVYDGGVSYAGTGTYARLRATATDSVGTGTQGFQLGANGAVNLQMDRNSIQVYSGTGSNKSAIGVNSLGGDVTIGSSTSTVSIPGTTSFANVDTTGHVSAGGAIYTSTGNIRTFNGDLYTSSGNIYTSSGGFTGDTIRLTSTTDVTAISTAHAFQIGAATSGTANLRIDSNEIGAFTFNTPSTLSLNNLGGTVSIGSTSSDVLIKKLTVAGYVTNAADGTLGTTTSIPKSVVGLGNVENTALSTWGGSTNITTVGSISAGTWNATAIADGKIASALTGKTYNGLTITTSTGTLTIAASKTLTVNNTIAISATNDSNSGLNIGGGGTLGSAAFTASTAYISSTLMSALGDTIYGGASGAATKLLGNTTSTKKFLRQTGDGTASAAPAWDTVTKTDVGLGNVDNTTDANKPVSTATQTALDLKANLASPAFTGTATSTGLTVNGLLEVQTGAVRVALFGGDANGSIELGKLGVSTTPFIDFHSGATTTDYDSRIIASGGNGTSGQGTLTYNAATHVFSGGINNAVFTGNIPTVTGSDAGSVKYDTNLVNRAYLDSQIINLIWREQVKCATTAALGASDSNSLGNLLGGTITPTYSNVLGTTSTDGTGYFGITSSTSQTIASSGSLVFALTLASSPHALSIGQSVRISVTDTPSTYMDGTITLISQSSMTVTINASSGSGTYSTWTISTIRSTLTVTPSVNWTQVTIDGQSLAINDRVLIKNQTAALQNGIYVVTGIGAVGTTTPFIFTRAFDSDLASENFVRYGVYVQYGSTYSDKTFTNIVNGDVTMGTTSLTFALAGGLANAIVPTSGTYRIPYTNATRGLTYTNASTQPGQLLKSGYAAPGANAPGWYDANPFEVKTGKIASGDWDTNTDGEATVTFNVPFPKGVVPNITFTPVSSSTNYIHSVTLKALPNYTGFTAIIRSWDGTNIITSQIPTTYWIATQGGRTSKSAIDITATSGNGSLVTITTDTAHGFITSDKVTIAGVVPTGYNGTYTVSTSSTIRYNYCLNPNFTTNATNWTGAGATGRDTTRFYQTPASLSVGTDGTVFTAYYTESSSSKYYSGGVYTSSAYVYTGSACGVTINIDFYNGNILLNGSVQQTFVMPAATWTRVNTGAATAPAGTNKIRLWISKGTGGGIMNIDAVLIEPVDTLGTYFDGPTFGGAFSFTYSDNTTGSMTTAGYVTLAADDGRTDYTEVT